MKVHLDSRLIRKLVAACNENERTALLNEYAKTLAILENSHLQIVLRWPSLLEYLGLSSLFDTLQKLNDQNKIFSSVIEVLKIASEKEVLIYLYDQIFVECLTQVKGLLQIHPEKLIILIRNKRKNTMFSLINDPFSSSLEEYEKKLMENPNDLIHDLTLYLAWDRVCVYLASLFDHTSLQIRNGLDTLKECLIESFQHITLQGRTSPSFFRLMEALYAYEMKEENLQKHTDADWQVLCQGATILKPRELLADVSYIDAGITNAAMPSHPHLKFLTVDEPARVKACLSLAEYMMAKLRPEAPDWKYAHSICTSSVFCWEKSNSNLS